MRWFRAGGLIKLAPRPSAPPCPCLQCGSVFQPVNRRHRHCSQACSDEANPGTFDAEAWKAATARLLSRRAQQVVLDLKMECET